jgi:hypothetical protein
VIAGFLKPADFLLEAALGSDIGFVTEDGINAGFFRRLIELQAP